LKHTNIFQCANGNTEAHFIMNSPVLPSAEFSKLDQGIRIFLMGATAILVATGLAKFITVLGDSRILDRPDTIFTFLTNRQLLFGVAVLELSVATLIVSRWLQMTGKLALIAWLGAAFLTYRVAAVGLGKAGPCRCLGNLTDALGIAPATADLAMKFALGYLLMGSIIFLFLLFRRGMLGGSAARQSTPSGGIA
jgi:hypothetical protein